MDENSNNLEKRIKQLEKNQKDSALLIKTIVFIFAIGAAIAAFSRGLDSGLVFVVILGSTYFLLTRKKNKK
jgi:hypothetical protein